MVVVTNTGSYASVNRIDTQDVTKGDAIIALTKQTATAPIAANI
jgi:PTS system sucrose-specific IIC component